MREAVTIPDAAETWLKRTEHAGTLKQYRSAMNRMKRYIDRWNVADAGTSHRSNAGGAGSCVRAESLRYFPLCL